MSSRRYVCPLPCGIQAVNSIAGSVASCWSASRSARNWRMDSAQALADGGAEDEGQYASGHLRSLIVRIAAEVQDVALRDPQMLDELPRRVRQFGRAACHEGRPECREPPCRTRHVRLPRPAVLQDAPAPPHRHSSACRPLVAQSSRRSPTVARAFRPAAVTRTIVVRFGPVGPEDARTPSHGVRDRGTRSASSYAGLRFRRNGLRRPRRWTSLATSSPSFTPCYECHGPKKTRSCASIRAPGS